MNCYCHTQKKEIHMYILLQARQIIEMMVGSSIEQKNANNKKNN